jgi:hypothetical protein
MPMMVNYLSAHSTGAYLFIACNVLDEITHTDLVTAISRPLFSAVLKAHQMLPLPVFAV